MLTIVTYSSLSYAVEVEFASHSSDATGLPSVASAILAAIVAVVELLTAVVGSWQKLSECTASVSE